jgi:hypothetical protein
MRIFEFLPFKRHKFRMRDKLCRGGFQRNGKENANMAIETNVKKTMIKIKSDGG